MKFRIFKVQLATFKNLKSYIMNKFVFLFIQKINLIKRKNVNRVKIKIAPSKKFKLI